MINSSFESAMNQTANYRDLNTDNDAKSINTNISYGQFSTNRFIFRNNLIEQKERTSTYVSNNDLLKDTSSLGLTMFKKDEKSKLRNKIINLNKEKYKDSWININNSQEISKIILIKVVDQCYFEGHLNLKNKLDSEYILGKFINNKNFYTITPSLFFIKPRSEIMINIKRFYKLATDEPSSKVKDYILLTIGKTKTEIEDLNDVKYHLRKDDIYSPQYQLFSYSLILDNGCNPLYYDNLVNERKERINLFYSKTNVNEITDPNLIRENIDKVKVSIQEYKYKIKQKEKEFEAILQNFNKNESVIKESINKNANTNKNIIVDKEVFYEVKNKKEKLNSKDADLADSKHFYNKFFDMTHDEDGITIPLLLFGLSICLFIGKFIKFAIFK